MEQGRRPQQRARWAENKERVERKNRNAVLTCSLSSHLGGTAHRRRAGLPRALEPPAPPRARCAAFRAAGRQARPPER